MLVKQIDLAPASFKGTEAILDLGLICAYKDYSLNS
jgi:hypothetical protein